MAKADSSAVQMRGIKIKKAHSYNTKQSHINTLKDNKMYKVEICLKVDI